MSNLDKLRVLVIDDSRQIREFVIEYILKPRSFQVDVAVDGAEGLRKALDTSPDLILMDYEMPRMNGLEVLQALRKTNAKIPVILMTSHGSEQVAVEVFRLGVQDYVTKPFTVEQMTEAIQDALAVTYLQREKEALTRRVIQTNQQLEQRVHELNVLYHIGKSITALMHPERLLERIVDAMLYMTKAEEGTLVLIEPDTGQFKKHVKRRRDTKNGNERAQQESWRYTGQLHLAAVGGEKIHDNVISVPLQVGKRVVGTLSISKPASSQVTPHDEQLLGMLADYAAIAIHNLQLMRQLHSTKEHEKRQIRGMFERYVSPSVVEQVLAKPDQVRLGGTRRTVTVLFADVRGFSAFSSQTSPEVLIELLNRYMQVAAHAIMTQEGTLDKFMGDAIMAFFNAPLPQFDHPVRAVRAAWEMSRAVKQLHQRLLPSHRLYFGVGVGIGEAVVGNVGTSQMMNYTVIGDSVNRVKRLQENAKGGQILISQETYHLIENYFQAECIGNIYLKGQSQPEPVYQVMKLRSG